MEGITAVVAARLAKVGWDFEGELLARAVSLVRRRSDRPETLTDLDLMSICVEAYRKPETEHPVW